MDILALLQDYALPFLVVLSIVIFFHELGHYGVARLCGVKVETFSIGFGPEIVGWTAKTGTRWKISVLPLGGYVKMFGDADAASRPDAERLRAEDAPADPGAPGPMTAEERAVSFHHKTLGQRAAIIAAGPMANFVLAVVILAGVFVFAGQPYTPPVIGEVVEGTAAERAGFQQGDEVVALDGTRIDRFEELATLVGIRPDQTMTATVIRDGERLQLTFTPDRVEEEDRFGTRHVRGVLGVRSEGVRYVQHDPVAAVGHAGVETVGYAVRTMEALGQIITGTRPASELGGPIRIAKISGDVAQIGIVALLTLAAILSVNLGLINLFPIPMLDGGHLMFYLAEWIRGRPLGERAQEYGFRLGFAMVIGLMLFVTWNDIVQLFLNP